MPLLHEGGIQAFLRSEVLPFTPEAWYNPAKIDVGYQFSFARHFFKPQPLPPPMELRADILALERGMAWLLAEIVERRAGILNWQ